MVKDFKDLKDSKFVCHDKSVEGSLNLLESSEKGLSESEVLSRQEKFGKTNYLVKRK